MPHMHFLESVHMYSAHLFFQEVTITRGRAHALKYTYSHKKPTLLQYTYDARVPVHRTRDKSEARLVYQADREI